MKLTIRAAACLLAAGTFLATVAAAPATATTDAHAGVQNVLNRAVTEGGLPGATAQVVQNNQRWFGRAGVADLTTGALQRPQDRFRIGYTTQTFVATVMLQLAAEHTLSLDDSVEQWLPGVVDGNGYDGSKITIRELLSQTSGVYNYVLSPTVEADAIGTPFLTHRFDDVTSDQLLGYALANPPAFAPGTSWGYADTNYLLAGLIIEKATGQSLAEEINERIICPLHLTGTYEPQAGDFDIDGPHVNEYSHLNQYTAGIPAYDVTELNPAWVFATGDLISTTGDLDTFFSALLQGRLLPPAEQREMFTMTQTSSWLPGITYGDGLGITSTTLSCGTTVYGMWGAVEGSWTNTYGTRDGSHLLSTNVNGDWLNGTDWTPALPAPIGAFTAEMESEFC
ncbi:MAG TPA: serine hydrolase domain-containing protein [Pseudonocardiaceae bacterium]|nr:serine hydrolase domain-containing protein [Pseudonocardiaceae bacterium]